MERISVQHGARLDDQLEHEAEALTHGAVMADRAQEHREIEDTADAVQKLRGRRDEWVTERSELARHLRPSAFPSDVAGLLAVAREEHAPPEAIELIECAPRGRQFQNVGELWEAVHGEREHRGAYSDATARGQEHAGPGPLSARGIAAIPHRAIEVGAGLIVLGVRALTKALDDSVKRARRR